MQVATRRLAPPPAASTGGKKDLQGDIKAARTLQLQASDLLAKLLQAPAPKGVAQEHADSLTEEFFHIGGAYLAMVRACSPTHLGLVG